ncbi:23S rRNA (pseudouridine(1915)-N(3))-methyltransferase RlmH [Meiothermus hypogaeus]|uniref:Ribosomal RNA large subunit methyltransferase H n=2 Tax=Meiothermus hypogaeus TaxID=884155 RepID=A0A511QY65_9DEIN|nr:23S rRNA (pseudouridine(1915)-N(3))-methyltransferase RlmH [Meiothermus hypogaeus]RIH77399.1 Ribosomal RNA large subunit methyltransferase H [Meiothermus hypogaeus]GEM82341.1 ribosomal RNA large subunit methyltransferase H [Meiothermus hypogaeus NBRC 106114]GIW37225.1 MAG: ribosomal RNA large subunit methyltransferase H [Meiothermus sp.]
MKLRVCVIGKPKLLYAKAGVEEYLKRLQRYTKLELLYLKEGTPVQEGQRLLEASAGYKRVVLDERGQMPDTLALGARLEAWEVGEKGVAFLIGGADGHSQAVRDEADWLLALSKLTLQHELALVVLLEQLYRVETLKRGEPYHR